VKTINIRKWIHVTLAAMLVLAAGVAVPSASQPAQAKTDERWVMPETVSAGYRHTCGVKGDGSLAC
jgi:hypothetical protein